MLGTAPQADPYRGVGALLDKNPVVGEPKRGARRFWTTREIAILKSNWTGGGIATCLSLLPGRTASAIYGKALSLDLTMPETVRRGIKRQRHSTTEFIDAAIRRAYQASPTAGSIKRLADTIMRPRSWARKRAEQLGCVVPRFKEPPWSAEEIAILESAEAKKPDAIARLLKRRGYNRTSTAVSVMLKRRHIQVDRDDPNHMSARGLAVLLGVDDKTVTRLIAQGLPATRRGTARERGDEWRISRKSLRRYIADNPTSIDIRKVDAVWLIDLLVSRS